MHFVHLGHVRVSFGSACVCVYMHTHESECVCVCVCVCVSVCIYYVSVCVCVCWLAATGSLEVCRQCVECGVRHGQRKRTREIVTWLKKKRRVIRRDELLAFLLDKPYTPQQDSPCYHFGAASEQSDVPHHPYSQHSHPAPSLPSSHITTRPFPVSSCIDGLNYSAPVPLVPLPIPMSTSDPCFSAPLPTPRGGRWALIGRDEQGIQSDAGDVYSVREGGRKRLNSSSTAANFEFVQESPPLAKRMKI